MQEDVYNLLASSVLPTLINGGIYLSSQPLGSKKEDIVIGVLAATASQYQTGILNVNIHVPNLNKQDSEHPNAVDNIQPDKERLNQIGKVAVSILDHYEGLDFSIAVRKPGVIEGYQNDWFYNIQIEYSFLREDIND